MWQLLAGFGRFYGHFLTRKGSFPRRYLADFPSFWLSPALMHIEKGISMWQVLAG
jgi:hypothetical protein